MRGGKVQYRRVNSQVGTPLVGKTRRSETLGASSSHEGYSTASRRTVRTRTINAATRQRARCNPTTFGAQVGGHRGGLTEARALVESAETSNEEQAQGTFGAWRGAKARDTPWNIIPEMWRHLAETLPKDTVALVDENNGKGEGVVVQLTYEELHDEICLFAWGLKSLGAEKGQSICIFSENSARWLVADQGGAMIGCTSALRGITSPVEELSFIAENSQARGLIVQNEQTLNQVWPTMVKNGQHEQIGFVVVLWDGVAEKRRPEGDVPVLTYDDVIESGRKASTSDSKPLAGILDPNIKETDAACIIYTSGTTGQPKGAMLSHKNMMYQVVNLHNVIAIPPKTQVISLLPPWHVYQLATSYYSYSWGITNRYSNVANFSNDLREHGCDFIVAVPLVIENLYKKVMQSVKKMPAARRNLVSFFLKASRSYVTATRVVKGLSLKHVHEPPSFLKLIACWLVHLFLGPIHALANALVYKKIRDQIKISRTIVSGGGALSDHLEDFFETVGVEIINGWGLTETSPVIAARCCAVNQSDPNARGTIGRPVPGTQVKCVDPETLEEVPDGTKGLMIVKGATVFGGYKQNQEATDKAFRYGDGWFDTGDLGYIAPSMPHHNMGGMCVLVGREKETIVLNNSENVEPSPLEQACLASPYIEQIMVVGQDRKALGALVVPEYEALAEDGVVGDASDAAEVEAFLKAEIKRKVEERDLFKPQESIRQISLLPEPLTFEAGYLTRTMKVRRHIVAESFASEIEAMFS